VSCRADLYSFPVVPEPLDLLARSQLAEATGDLATATSLAASFAASDPASSYAAARVAGLCEASGDDVQALAWGEQALALDSLNASAAMLVGRMHLRSGEFGLAVQVLTPPLRMLGAPPELYALRAIAHELNRNYEAAIADLRRTDMLEDDFAWVASGVLGLALEENRLDEAYLALELALELSPGDGRVLANGIELAHRAGDRVLEETLLRRRAIADGSTLGQVAAYGAVLVRADKGGDFEILLRWAAARRVEPIALRIETARALLADREYLDALRTLRPCRREPGTLTLQARALAGLGEEGKALRCLREARSLGLLSHEDSLDAVFYEGRVGDRSDAVILLESVRPTLFESAGRLVRGSLCYSVLGHPEEAVALLREGAARGVESPPMYQELGVAASGLGDSLVAEWAFQRLHSLGRETSECMFYLGAADLSRGEPELGLQRLERAVTLNPQNGPALLLLGTVRSQRGQLELARDALIRAACCPSSSVEANRALARVCRALRLEREAREAESRARSRHPQPPPGLSLSQTP
jgi:tetratricopeptide (TPR) repeat protein